MVSFLLQEANRMIYILNSTQSHRKNLNEKNPTPTTMYPKNNNIQLSKYLTFLQYTLSFHSTI